MSLRDDAPKEGARRRCAHAGFQVGLFAVGLDDPIVPPGGRPCQRALTCGARLGSQAVVERRHRGRARLVGNLLAHLGGSFAPRMLRDGRVAPNQPVWLHHDFDHRPISAATARVGKRVATSASWRRTADPVSNRCSRLSERSVDRRIAGSIACAGHVLHVASADGSRVSLSGSTMRAAVWFARVHAPFGTYNPLVVHKVTPKSVRSNPVGGRRPPPPRSQGRASARRRPMAAGQSSRFW